MSDAIQNTVDELIALAKRQEERIRRLEERASSARSDLNALYDRVRALEEGGDGA